MKKVWALVMTLIMMLALAVGASASVPDKPSEFAYAYDFDGYTAQITMLQSSLLRTYGELTLTFDEETDDETREAILSDYLEGLLAPEGELDIHAGEGEEIAYPTGAAWQKDRLTAIITLEGNPRESYPETAAFYPRKGASQFDGEGDWPKLSEQGAIEIKME